MASKHKRFPWLATLFDTAVVLVVIIGLVSIATGLFEISESLGPFFGSIVDGRIHGWN